MAPSLLPSLARAVNPPGGLPRWPEQELQAKDHEQRLEDAEEGILAHAVDEATAYPRAADHHHPDVEAGQDQLARQEVGAAEHDPAGDIGANRAEGIGGQVAPPAQAVAQEERRHERADRSHDGREEAKAGPDQREMPQPHSDASVGEPVPERHRKDHERAQDAGERLALEARVERRADDRHGYGAHEKGPDHPPFDLAAAEPDARAVAHQHAHGEYGDRRLDTDAPGDGRDHDHAGAEARDAADRGTDDGCSAEDQPAGRVVHDALVYSTPCRSSWRQRVSCSSGSTLPSTSRFPPCPKPSALVPRPSDGSSSATSARTR